VLAGAAINWGCVETLGCVGCPCQTCPMFATLHTSAGDIRVELFENHAPTTVANFTGLATGEKAWKDPKTGTERTDPLYTDVVFHRVINGFMIQGGDPLGSGRGGPGYNFDDEIHPELQFSEPYLLAMANAGKRRDPISGKVGGTNGSQFFITVGKTPHLNGKHTIFGKVADAESRAVVDAIATTPVDRDDRPLTAVTITSISIDA